MVSSPRGHLGDSSTWHPTLWGGLRSSLFGRADMDGHDGTCLVAELLTVWALRAMQPQRTRRLVTGVQLHTYLSRVFLLISRFY